MKIEDLAIEDFNNPPLTIKDVKHTIDVRVKHDNEWGTYIIECLDYTNLDNSHSKSVLSFSSLKQHLRTIFGGREILIE